LAKPYLVACTTLTLLINGCAYQSYHAQPLAPAETAGQFSSRDLSSADLQRYMQAQGYPADTLPVKAWGLRELTWAAFFYHPQLAIAQGQWRAAQAQIQTAGQRPNPSISGSGEHHSRHDGGVSPWTLGIGFDIPIETGGKRAARVDQAASLAEAARLEIGQQAWDIRNRLHVSWIAYTSAVNAVPLRQREIALQTAIVEMLEKRLQAGAASTMETAAAKLQLQRLRNQQAREQATIAELRADLAAAVGVPLSALDRIELDSSTAPSFPAPPTDDIRKSTLLNRLDVRAALASYDAAEAKLRLEIARQYPDVNLLPGYSYDQGDNRWSLGFSTLLQLLNRNEGPIAEAQAARELEARRFEALQARVIGEQEHAFASYRHRVDQLNKAAATLKAQEAQSAKSEAQYKAGYIDRLEWTTTQLEALVAAQNRQESETQAAYAAAALENAMQRPLDGMALSLPEQNRQELQ
jgi:outer membrane protein TolC